MSRGGGMNRSAEAAAGGGLPPGGPAGGDLNGLYPSPGVIGFRGASFNPQIDNTSDIGSTALRVQDVHAVTFVAHADATNTLRATLAAASLLSTTAFAIDATGDLTLGGAASTTAVLVGDPGTPTPFTVFGPTSLIDNLTIAGSVALGDTAADQIVFNGRMNSSILPIVDNTHPIGSSALRFLGVHATTFVARNDATDTTKATLTAFLLIGTSSFQVQSASVTGVVAASIVVLERSGGGQFWVTGSGFQVYQAGALVRTDTLSGAGANTFEFAPGVASITESWTQDAAAAGGIWGRVGQQGANGFAGGAVAITGGAAGTTGARTAGGELRLFGGAGGGNAGGAAAGGDVVISPGAGSSGGGVSGQVRLTDSAGTSVVEVDGTGLGFFNIGPVARQDVVGSRISGAALTDLLTKLAATGFITDSTVA